MKIFIYPKQQSLQSIIESLEETNVEIVYSIDECDVILAMGGDGTVLHVAQDAIKHNKPILGYNTGNLGFLSNDGNLTNLLNLFIANKCIED